MKKLFLLQILFFSLVCFSQNKKLVKGNELYDLQKFNEALEIFLEEEHNLTQSEDLADLKIKIATCYSNLHQPTLAVENYEKAMLFGADLTTDQTIEYARTLIEIAKYEEAKKILVDLDAGMFIEDILIKTCDYAINHPETNTNIRTYNLNELPANASFGIDLYRDNLIYIFNNEQRNQKDNSGLFGYVGRQDLTITDLNKLSLPPNTNSPAVDEADNILYFSASALYLEKISKKNKNDLIGLGGIDNLFIYSVNYKLPKPIPEKLPFNNIDFSCTHPCISTDGNTLYFSSNMLGGYGEFDIYSSKKTENGWSTPQNLGTKINTFLNEGYPYILGDYLYFSSDGHPGYGGLDVFRYNLKTGELENPGKPLNSSFDDFYFFINDTGEGFFVSNRLEDKGDIIFKFVEK